MRRIALALAIATSISAANAFGAAPLPPFQPDANGERAKIPATYKWDLTPVFKDEAAFEAALKKVAEGRGALAKRCAKLADPLNIHGCLQTYFQVRLDTNKLTLYGHLVFDGAQKSSKAKSMNDRALKAMNDLMEASSSIRQELLKLPDSVVLSAYEATPALAEYKPYLEEIRRRRSRVLGAEAERVLSLAGDNLWAEIDLNEIPSDHEKTFNAALSSLALPKITDDGGKEVQLTLANYPRFRASTDRRIRRDAVEKLFATLRSQQDVFAGTLAGQINFNILLARARGYDTAVAAYLDKDDIDPKVYKTLIGAAHANVAPLHRYLALRKKVLGVPDMHVYDLYSPIVASVKMEFPYAKAMEVIPEALAPLGTDYTAALRSALDPASGWVDVFPHKDKESGAFCINVFGTHPYVKMNYFEDFDSLSVLAHEYGHAMHSDLAMKKQPYVTSGYVPFLAEIASTFNEKLLNDFLVKNAQSDDEKLFILNQLVERMRTTIFRQALFAEFELAIHTAAEKGTPLTAEFLNKTYRDLLKVYYGKDLTLGENDEVEWAYIPHFYYKYYVYSYATGLSAALALAEKVQTGDPKARDAYLAMLSGGSSKPPLELLKAAGADLTKPDAFAAAARLMDRTVGEMEKLLAKRIKAAPAK